MAFQLSNKVIPAFKTNLNLNSKINKCLCLYQCQCQCRFLCNSRATDGLDLLNLNSLLHQHIPNQKFPILHHQQDNRTVDGTVLVASERLLVHQRLKDGQEQDSTVEVMMVEKIVLLQVVFRDHQLQQDIRGQDIMGVEMIFARTLLWLVVSHDRLRPKGILTEDA